jgi:hypothetical protein
VCVYNKNKKNPSAAVGRSKDQHASRDKRCSMLKKIKIKNKKNLSAAVGGAETKMQRVTQGAAC